VHIKAIHLTKQEAIGQAVRIRFVLFFVRRELELNFVFDDQVLGAFGVFSCFVIASLLFYLLVSLLAELNVERRER